MFATYKIKHIVLLSEYCSHVAKFSHHVKETQRMKATFLYVTYLCVPFTDVIAVIIIHSHGG